MKRRARNVLWWTLPNGTYLMKSWAFARRAASCTSSSDAPGFPYRMFSLIDVWNSTGSCVAATITHQATRYNECLHV
jgi:hypothetical protein